MKIKTEKVVIDGEPKRKLLGFEFLKTRELPLIYLTGTPRCYLTDMDSLVIITREDHIRMYTIGDIVEEITFQEIIIVLRNSADRLKKIKKQLTKECVGWKGEETITI